MLTHSATCRIVACSGMRKHFDDLAANFVLYVSCKFPRQHSILGSDKIVSLKNFTPGNRRSLPTGPS